MAMKLTTKTGFLKAIESIGDGPWSSHVERCRPGDHGKIETFSFDGVPVGAVQVDFESGKALAFLDEKFFQ